ncbi:PAS domain S-box protein [Vogesella sp. LIG4]|uniref:PAS domain S-box protein n=1 Tax=Vogesella sp. LIG4 TaxID=1192162 RepID=UPI00081FCFAC|nr:PAS domain S-box protein [Vogesella sp. LIG4]SCK20561.1 PAS domain S-box-containing protein/diguanylate cyclase (GGDEF) domain-containing protein [Vogesella sp. LIG4]
MSQAALPPFERERLSLLLALQLLDTPAEVAFDRITRLASQLLQVPIALVSLVDEKRQWFKSRVGLEAQETPREFAFCAHALLQAAPLVVEDATRDSRFADNPLVTTAPGIRFYAGVQLLSRQGYPLGTLCVIDTVPRTLAASQLAVLQDLAGIVTEQLQQRERSQQAQKQIEEAQQLLREREQRLRLIFEHAGVGIALLGPDGGWFSVNDTLSQITGYPREELLALRFADLAYPADAAIGAAEHAAMLRGKIDRYQVEKRYLCRDGSLRWVSLVVTRQYQQQDQQHYLIVIVKDIQARKAAEAELLGLRQELEQRVQERTAQLQQSNNRLSAAVGRQRQIEQQLRKREAELTAVLEHASEAYICIDEHGLVIAWNRQASETFGWAADEVLGKPLAELIIPPPMRSAHHGGLLRYLQTGEAVVLDHRLELPALTRDGRTIPVEMSIRALQLEDQLIFSAFLHDISERKAAEQQREFEARHDALTGLPNRRAFFERLRAAQTRVQEGDESLALLFIDLDGFKEVNDRFGHDAGDSVLREVASRLRSMATDGASIARLGGDEMIILLQRPVLGESAVQALAEQVRSVVGQPVPLGEAGAQAQVSASIGIAMQQPGETISPDQLVARADKAMYGAKRSGKARVRWG